MDLEILETKLVMLKENANTVLQQYLGTPKQPHRDIYLGMKQEPSGHKVCQV